MGIPFDAKFITSTQGYAGAGGNTIADTRRLFLESAIDEDEIKFVQAGKGVSF